MDIFVKCVLIAIVTAVVATMIKRYLPEVSTIILIIAVAAIFISLGHILGEVFDFVENLAEIAGISNELLNPVFKVSAIAILSRIACDICRDVGASSLVTVVELCASAVAIILSLPLFNMVIGLITRM